MSLQWLTKKYILLVIVYKNIKLPTSSLYSGQFFCLSQRFDSLDLEKQYAIKQHKATTISIIPRSKPQWMTYFTFSFLLLWGILQVTGLQIQWSQPSCGLTLSDQTGRASLGVWVSSVCPLALRVSPGSLRLIHCPSAIRSFDMIRNGVQGHGGGGVCRVLCSRWET